MRRGMLLTALLAALAAGASTLGAAAMPIAAPASRAVTAAPAFVHPIGWSCRCARNWGPREYWRWDHRPIWDDPWRVLKPNFWGSPEPHLVPADVWARKWRLRYPWRHRHWHPE
jgi:hypothetical protein